LSRKIRNRSPDLGAVAEALENARKPPVLPVLREDAATIEGLIDLLCHTGAIPGETPDKQLATIRSYIEAYNSPLSALIMLCIDHGMITERELELSISVFHEGVRHWGTKGNYDEVFAWRLRRLRTRLEHEKKGQA
jgi:hypothetical protein